MYTQINTDKTDYRRKKVTTSQCHTLTGTGKVTLTKEHNLKDDKEKNLHNFF